MRLPRGTPSLLLSINLLWCLNAQGTAWNRGLSNRNKDIIEEDLPSLPAEVVDPTIPILSPTPEAPSGLDLKGVDAQSLINPDFVGRLIPAGQCGVYRRGSNGAEVSLCVESVVEYGNDLKQLNAFLVNSGTAGLCDFLIRPFVPTGATMDSFWPDWALEDMSEVYIEPAQIIAIGMTVVPGPQENPQSLPRIDVVAFKDCSPSGVDADQDDVNFEISPIDMMMPEAVVITAAAGDPMQKRPATKQEQQVLATVPEEGQCAIYSKPASGTNTAQATLCIESILHGGSDVVQVNGLLLNTGTAPLCTVRLAAEQDAQYSSMWPRWASQGHSKDNFMPGDAIAVGLTSPGRADGSRPALALENFDVCGHPSTADVVRDPSTGAVLRPSPLEVVLVSMDDTLGAPEWVSLADYQEARGDEERQAIDTDTSATMETRQAEDTTAGTKIDAFGATPEQLAIPAGVCGVYRKGAAELSICSESVVTWGQDVQQLNGFMMNTGNRTICDIRIRPALPSASETPYSLWPDWASDASYEVFFDPGQMTAVGMTGPPTNTTPYIEIVSFRDCKDAAEMATSALSSFSTVPIETVQPPSPQEELTSIPVAVPIPSTEAAKEGFDDMLPEPVGEESMDTIREGWCALHTIRSSTMALCLESIIHWGTTLVQVNTFLMNLNEEDDVCDVEVAISTGPEGFDSLWPRWVRQGTYKKHVSPGEALPVGVAAPYDKAQPRNSPVIALRNFRACAEKKGLPVEAGDISPLVFLPIGMVKRVDEGPSLPRVEKEVNTAEGLARRMQEEDAELSPVSVSPGRCGMATGMAGLFQIRLCVDRANTWGDGIVQLAGRVENSGKEAICDMRLGSNFEKVSIATSWPATSAAGEDFEALLPGETREIGLTASPRGLIEGVAPMLSVTSFRPCGRQGLAVPSPPQPLQLTWEGPSAETAKHVLQISGFSHQDLGEGVQAESERRHLASKGKAAPTTFDTIDWELCGYYTGLDGESELALCWKDAKSWKDREMGRIVQTNLVLVNTGKLGVCNVTLEIENLDSELGDHYPNNWVDDDGRETFPSYPGYYAPEQIVNLGAAVPIASGFPDVSIAPTFTACQPPPPKPVAPRKADCTEVPGSGANADVLLNFCLYSKPKIWREYEGPRIVMVEGYIENIGQGTACNIEVDIENLQDAQATWGEWMPTYPYKLSPGSTLKFGTLLLHLPLIT